MSTDDTLPVLPPTPSRDGRPHVYVLNSAPGFLEMIAELLEDVRLNVTPEQLRPNVEVTLDNLRSAEPDLVVLDVVPHQQNATVQWLRGSGYLNRHESRNSLKIWRGMEVAPYATQGVSPSRSYPA